jgi:sugar-specific transcriptional regulator TrmB
MNTEILNLISLGLDEKAAKVYFAGLKTGSTTASNLAKVADIKRGTIYGIIQNLKKQNLCKESVLKGKTTFTMSDPNQLLLMQKERQSVLNYLLPSLRNVSILQNMPKVSIYNGVEEVKNVALEILQTKEKILSVENLETSNIHFGEVWTDNYIRERKKRKISTDVLAIKNSTSVDLAKSDIKDLRQIKFLPKEMNLDVDVVIYENKVLLISFDIPIFAVLIEDEKISKSFKNIFNFVWNFL